MEQGRGEREQPGQHLVKSRYWSNRVAGQIALLVKLARSYGASGATTRRGQIVRGRNAPGQICPVKSVWSNFALSKISLVKICLVKSCLVKFCLVNRPGKILPGQINLVKFCLVKLHLDESAGRTAVIGHGLVTAPSRPHHGLITASSRPSHSHGLVTARWLAGRSGRQHFAGRKIKNGGMPENQDGGMRGRPCHARPVLR